MTIKQGDIVELFNYTDYRYSSLLLYHTLHSTYHVDVPQDSSYDVWHSSYDVWPNSYKISPAPKYMIVLEALNKPENQKWYFKLFAENKVGWVSMINPDYLPRDGNENLYKYGIRKVQKNVEET